MSIQAKTFAAVAAIAALVVAFRGTAQALPTTDTVPNYNFQNWDRWQGGIYPGFPTATTSPTKTYTAMPDGYMTQYNQSDDYGTASYWYMAEDNGTPTFAVWNPTPSGSTVVAVDGATGAVTPAAYTNGKTYPATVPTPLRVLLDSRTRRRGISTIRPAMACSPAPRPAPSAWRTSRTRPTTPMLSSPAINTT